MNALLLALTNVRALRRRLVGQFVLVALAVGLCLTSFGIADNAGAASDQGLLESIANRSVTVDALTGRENAPVLSAAVVRDLAKLPGVASVEPRAQVSFGYKGPQVPGVLLYGTTVRPSLLPPVVASTRANVFPLGSHEAVLPKVADGTDLSVVLGKRIEVQTITRTGQTSGAGSADTVTVVGLFDPKWQIDGPGAAYLDEQTVIRWAALSEGVPAERYTSVIGYTTVSVVAALSRDVPKLLTAIQAKGFGAASLQQQLQALPPVLSLIRGASKALLVVLGLIALVATLALTGALVRQRTREIGILKATGFTNRSLFTTFVAEAVLTACAAVAVGVTLGIGGSWALASVLRRSSDLSDYLPTGVTLPSTSTVAVVAAVTLGVVAVGALLPASRAGRMDPLAAMRDW